MHNSPNFVNILKITTNSNNSRDSQSQLSLRYTTHLRRISNVKTIIASFCEIYDDEIPMK